ncbi:hypothetical protein G7085_02760 [Tessaracoccus sp. HDW20]|uniref:hypothetical protein n=1 Tax=Tessaracoccus coleopterorum TaxID=2714950 RepID=UPI0018D4A48F|nr:hypothetical protein [Tessaracoccus coleopterorum]NHB83945.1 hypothetical protein [Tessaracoccus coleopterorum]
MPAECAWLQPSIGVFRDDGVVPAVHPDCALPPGLVTDAATVGGGVELTVDGAVTMLERVPQAGLLAAQLWEAGGTIVFVAVLFALSAFATTRRPSDPSVASNLAFSSALLGSTVVTMVGLPPSWAFGGAARWLFELNVGLVYTLGWGALLTWALQTPTPLLPALGRAPARTLLTWGPGWHTWRRRPSPVRGTARPAGWGRPSSCRTGSPRSWWAAPQCCW